MTDDQTITRAELDPLDYLFAAKLETDEDLTNLSVIFDEDE